MEGGGGGRVWRERGVGEERGVGGEVIVSTVLLLMSFNVYINPCICTGEKGKTVLNLQVKAA